jgi:hypothetical protein
LFNKLAFQASQEAQQRASKFMAKFAVTLVAPKAAAKSSFFTKLTFVVLLSYIWPRREQLSFFVYQ